VARHHDLGNEGRPNLEDLLGLSAEDLEAIRSGMPQRAEEPPPPSEQNVLQDRYDGRLFGELYEASREIRALAESEGAPETFPTLLRDFFCVFYKAAPVLAPEESVEEPHRRQSRPFVERLLGDEKTNVARLWTRLDPLASGLATLAAGRRVLEEITERNEPEGAPRQAENPPPPQEEPPQGQETGENAPGEGAEAQGEGETPGAFSPVSCPCGGSSCGGGPAGG
jgi:hypothetical protein